MTFNPPSLVAFRFLLEVKWACWTLETLRFPTAYKKSRPYRQLNMVDFVFKRLALVRNWVMYSIQCIHSHLMTLVCQSMGQQLNKKVQQAECLRDIIDIHDSYIDAVHEHCFQKSVDGKIRKGIEQLLNLVSVLNDEWNNIASLKHNEYGCDSEGDEENGATFDLENAVSQVTAIETTFINCHCLIAEVLSSEVYTKDRVECKCTARK